MEGRAFEVGCPVRRAPLDSLADLGADAVLLLVQGTLVQLRDVAAILPRHGMFFAANLPIFFVQRGCLALADLATFHLVVDAPVLVIQARVDFGTARVCVLPRCLCHRADSEGGGA